MRFLPLLFLLFLFSCSGEEIYIKKNIQSKITDEHIHLKGTHLYMIPPKDFKPADNFIGFIQDEIALLRVNEYSDINYIEREQYFLDTFINTRGIADHDQITVGKYRGVYFKEKNLSQYVSYCIAFGDSTFMVEIIAVVNDKDQVSKAALFNTINSIVYKKDKKVNKLDPIRFSLDDSLSRYKFIGLQSHKMWYSMDTVFLKGDSITLDVEVIQLPVYEDQLPKISALQLQGELENMGYIFSKGRNASSDKINGYTAFQMELSTTITGENYILEIISIKSGNVVALIYGFVPYDHYKISEEIKKLAATIRFKDDF